MNKDILGFIQKFQIEIIFTIILLFSFVSKFWNLAYPDTYYFDEIYYGFTAEQYALENPKAWIYDYPAPKGFAYTWDHPPLGKLLMSVPIRIMGVSPLSRRVIPALAGTLLTLVAFLLAKEFFPKKPFIWLCSAFLISLDGLVLTLSRIALADTILTLFISVSILFLLRKNYFWSAIFWGASASVKWTGFFLIFYIAIILILSQTWSLNKKVLIKNFLWLSKTIILYSLITIIIYILSYAPLIHYWGVKKAIEINQQAYWYHTGLEATHPSQSSALSWPSNIKPVWFYVDYQKNTTSNIYSLGNPLIFWSSLPAIFFTFFMAIKTRKRNLWYLLLAYPNCWIQWVGSPRIMFLYHYLPAIPIICIIISFFLDQINHLGRNFKYFTVFYLFSVFVTFVYFFPFWTGLPVLKDQVDKFRWLKTWR